MILPAPPLTLNDVLVSSGLAPKDVIVLRHTPKEASLARLLPRLISERPELFDCYQSTHGGRTEASLKRARYAASFIGNGADTALFVGLYDLVAQREISLAECRARPLHRELVALGMAEDPGSSLDSKVLEFELRLTEWHEEWRGRLIIKWPPPAVGWFRFADRNIFRIEAIAVENMLSPPMPEWNHFTPEWVELALLPTSWRAKLSQWRGIYLIIDRSDGLQYVGSAYGSENILQRWQSYATTGHGGNKLLKGRNPAHFRFSILERLSPDTPDAEVVGIENGWKDRLRSRWPNGLNEN